MGVERSQQCAVEVRYGQVDEHSGRCELVAGHFDSHRYTLLDGRVQFEPNRPPVVPASTPNPVDAVKRFPREQQEMLERAVVLAQFAAGFVTMMHATVSEEEQKLLFLELDKFAHASYPKGPRQLAQELNEISRFCDLAIISTPRSLDDGRPM